VVVPKSLWGLTRSRGEVHLHQSQQPRGGLAWRSEEQGNICPESVEDGEFALDKSGNYQVYMRHFLYCSNGKSDILNPRWSQGRAWLQFALDWAAPKPNSFYWIHCDTDPHGCWMYPHGSG